MMSYNWYLVFGWRKPVILCILNNVPMAAGCMATGFNKGEPVLVYRRIDTWCHNPGIEKDWLALSLHSNGQRLRSWCTVTVKWFPVRRVYFSIWLSVSYIHFYRVEGADGQQFKSSHIAITVNKAICIRTWLLGVSIIFSYLVTPLTVWASVLPVFWAAGSDGSNNLKQRLRWWLSLAQ